jgi:hypothetical protein
VKLDVLAVLRTMLRLYAQQLPVLLGAAAVVYVLIDILTSVIWLFASDPGSAAAAAVITIAGSYYYEGAVALLLDYDRRGEPRPSLWRLFRLVPTMRLLGVELVVLVLGTVGFALAVVPGIVMLVVWFVVGPVVVLEGAGVRHAFERSRQLVRGNFWPVFVLLMIAIPVYALIAVALGLAGMAAGGGTVTGYFAAGLLGNLVFGPLAALAVVVTYFELERISEIVE